MDIAGSLLSLSASEQQVVRANSLELTLPIDVALRGSHDRLVFCADVPAWRWRTDWDPPCGQLRLTLEEARQETTE